MILNKYTCQNLGQIFHLDSPSLNSHYSDMDKAWMLTVVHARMIGFLC